VVDHEFRPRGVPRPGMMKSSIAVSSARSPNRPKVWFAVTSSPMRSIIDVRTSP